MRRLSCCRDSPATVGTSPAPAHDESGRARVHPQDDLLVIGETGTVKFTLLAELFQPPRPLHDVAEPGGLPADHAEITDV